MGFFFVVDNVVDNDTELAVIQNNYKQTKVSNKDRQTNLLQVRDLFVMNDF